MRALVAVLSQRPLPPGYAAALDAAVRRHLVAPAADIEHAEQTGSHSAVHLWTNEGPAESGVTRGARGWAASPGDPPLLDGTDLLTGWVASGLPDAAGAAAALRRATGDFGIVAGGAREILGVTSAAGPEPIYIAHDGGVAVVASRPVTAQLALRLAAGEPVSALAYDPVGVADIVAAGYRTGADTVLAGVQALTVGAAWSARRDRLGRLRLSTATLPPPARGKGTAAEVADALVRALRPHRSQGPISLGLTGGKDSRLALAALLAAEVPVRTHTRGLPDDPDVVVAARLAELAGVPHRVADPRTPAGVLHVDPVARVLSAVAASEGELSGYEIAGHPWTEFRPAIHGISGSGGEILRGGWADAALRNPSATQEWLRRVLHGRRPAVLRADVRRAHEDSRKGWLKAAAKDTPATLEDFFVVQRTGGWTAAARAAGALTGRVYSPFLDHAVVAAARAVDLRHRAEERLIHDVLGQLAPHIVDLPFADHRWRFERQPPRPRRRGLRDRSSLAEELAAWERRAPVTKPSGGKVFNWRLDAPQAVLPPLAEMVLGLDWSGLLGDVLDRGEVEALLTAEHLDRPEMHVVWRVASAAWLLAGDWWAPHPDLHRGIEVEVSPNDGGTERRRPAAS